MRKLVLDYNNEIFAGDITAFYETVSKFVGKKLVPKDDTISLYKLDHPTRSTFFHFVLCEINDTKWIGFKRCVDNTDFLRREIAIGQAKQLLGFPHYKIMKKTGLMLREKDNHTNYRYLADWQDKPLLIIDIGNYSKCKNLKELSPSDIADLNSFCYIYGSWAAFNYLLGVNDRKAENFIFHVDTQQLHSIDSEEDPFNEDGSEIDPTKMIHETRTNIKKFIDVTFQEQIQNLQTGFVEKFSLIHTKIPQLTMFTTKEQQLIIQKSKKSAHKLALTIFDI